MDVESPPPLEESPPPLETLLWLVPDPGVTALAVLLVSSKRRLSLLMVPDALPGDLPGREVRSWRLYGVRER